MVGCAPVVHLCVSAEDCLPWSVCDAEVGPVAPGIDVAKASGYVPTIQLHAEPWTKRQGTLRAGGPRASGVLETDSGLDGRKELERTGEAWEQTRKTMPSPSNSEADTTRTDLCDPRGCVMDVQT